MAGLDRDIFFDPEFRRGEMLTYGDISIYPGLSDFDKGDVDIAGKFSRELPLNVPMVSAAMDTVTTAPMAIAMAKLGGLGVIHAAMGVDEQYKEVRAVKLQLSSKIEKPITVNEDSTVGDVLQMCDERGFSFRTFPVVDDNGVFQGLLGQKDFDFALGQHDALVSEVMLGAKDVVKGKVDTDSQQAFELMKPEKVKTLPLINDQGRPTAMYMLSDVVRELSGNPDQYNLDADGRLRVAAAVSTSSSMLERVERLHSVVDAIVIDTAQGDGPYARAAFDEFRSTFPNIQLVIGNISNGDSAKYFADRGADGIKVGQGPGSICTTRDETGMGVTQATAVYECEKAVRGSGIPICADGGIVKPGDVSKAIALGASSVMMGRMLGGSKEAPGEPELEKDGRMVKYFRGMGSAAAMRDSEAARTRYGGDDSSNSPVPEGVESRIPYTGPVQDIIHHLVGSLKRGFSYVGSGDLETHRTKTKFGKMTSEGSRESSPHDIY